MVVFESNQGILKKIFNNGEDEKVLWILSAT